ncbi:hypothetical protein [Thermomonospora amylolytica]|uniref:hypothetical protein n=1 Tax=Thermomonospora amylolytica TaxID=1411117 RepID=UPI000E6BBE24|nr:hypothetical protein [Thermomonospora amylolytica]
MNEDIHRELSEALAALRANAADEDYERLADVAYSAATDGRPESASERLESAEKRAKAARRKERERIMSLLAERDDE